MLEVIHENVKMGNELADMGPTYTEDTGENG